MKMLRTEVAKYDPPLDIEISSEDEKDKNK